MAIPTRFIKTGSTVTGIAEFQTGETLDAIWLPTSVAAVNMLINGDMRINQRVFAGGSLAANVFGYDRWFADTGGANISVNTSGVITHNSGTICQAIESPRNAFGVTVTLSVADLSGGSLNVNVGGVTGVITSGTGRRYISLSSPAAGSSGNLLIKLTPASGAVSYREVALVRGGDMAGFDYLPRSVVIANCQRFYEKSYEMATPPATATDVGQSAFFIFGLPSSSYAGGMSTPYKVIKAVMPAVTMYSPQTGATGMMYNAGTSADVAAAATSPSTNSFFAQATSLFGPTTTINLRWHWVANSEITS